MRLRSQAAPRVRPWTGADAESRAAAVQEKLVLVMLITLV